MTDRQHDAAWQMCSGASGAVRDRHRSRRHATTASLAARVPGFAGDRFRTAVTRTCVAAGVAALSPHDLRHRRRISLLHLGGVRWTRIGEHVGQRNLAVTANTYSHVLVDEPELDYAELFA